MGKYKTRKNIKKKYRNKNKKHYSKKQKKGGMLRNFLKSKRQRTSHYDTIIYDSTRNHMHPDFEPGFEHGLEVRGGPTNRQLQLRLEETPTNRLQLIPEEIKYNEENEENEEIEEIIGNYANVLNPNCESWVSVLIQDSGENNNCETKVSPFQSPTRNIQQNETKVSSPLGDFNKIMKTPDTNDVIVGVSLIDFAKIIIEYLKKLEKNKLKGMKLQDYLYRKLGTQFKEIPTEDEIKLDNYYQYFLCLLQSRGFTIFDGDDHKLNDYFDKSVFNDSNQKDFNRKEFFEFASTIFPSINFNETLKNKLRIDFTGESLASVTGQGTNYENPNEYISSFEKNTRSGENCNPDEINWIKECIENRKNNYLYKKDNKHKWKLQTREEAKKIGKKIKSDVFKQECGKCWICNYPIYHYYWKNGNEIIYLNSKCGEDEHVFPPGIGDIIGTLNQSGKIMKKIISQKGPETLYLYGLRPSHSFCNQVKSDFLFYYLMKLNGIIVDNKLNKEWADCCDNWFKKSRNHSFENIAVKFGKDYILYYNHTITTIRKYLNENIAIKLKDQAEKGASNIGNMLKLKLLIYIVQIGKDIIGDEFTEKWNIKLTKKLN